MIVDIQKLKTLAETVRDLEDTEQEDELAEAKDALWLHMHCHTILELIAEIEALRAAKNTVECRFEVSEDTLKTIRGCLASAEGDIDQLKAENANGLAVLRTQKQQLECYMRDNESLKAENEVLRQIVSDSATSCGAAVSVECSLDFMAHLPAEIASVISGLRADAERYRWLRMFTIKGVSLNIAGALESLDRQIDDFSKEASHD